MLSYAFGERGLNLVPDSVGYNTTVRVDDVEGASALGLEVGNSAGVSPRGLLREKNQEAFIVGVPPFLVEPHLGEGGLAAL